MTSSLLQNGLIDGRRAARACVGRTVARARWRDRRAGARSRSPGPRPRSRRTSSSATGLGHVIVTGAVPSNRNTVASTRHTRSSRPAFEMRAWSAAASVVSATVPRGSIATVTVSRSRARAEHRDLDVPRAPRQHGTRRAAGVARQHVEQAGDRLAHGAECPRRSSVTTQNGAVRSDVAAQRRRRGQPAVDRRDPPQPRSRVAPEHAPPSRRASPGAPRRRP